MVRQVDIRALVSHIVRGDGADKCRICMGDTTEGQVYLGDTVMVDEDKPVTLAELLQTITGVEVKEDSGLPSGVCRICYEETMGAAHFRQFCTSSVTQWTQTITSLVDIGEPLLEDKAFYVFLQDDVARLIRDQTVKTSKSEGVLKGAVGETDKKSKSTNRMKKKKTLGKSCKCECPDCGKEFVYPYYLNVHLASGKKSACLVCGVVLVNDKILKHYARRHGDVKFICQICGVIFDEKSSLEEHRASHSKGPYKCADCGKQFPNERGLLAHVYSHSLFNCDCGKNFENRKCFKYHKKRCNRFRDRVDDSLFVCDLCGNRYSKKPSLSAHMLQKHINVLPYVCETCGKRTSTLSHLKAHELTHANRRRVYQCMCGSKFLSEIGFQLHQRLHTGEKPYECESCGEKFISSSRKQDHIKRRHTSSENKPHGCTVCFARFVRPVELRKHSLTAHPKATRDRFEE